MRESLDTVMIDGTIVIGEGERDEAPMLYIGEQVGRHDGSGVEQVDIAVDPLEGTNLVATGQAGAITVLAASEKGGLVHAPDTYLEKLCVGPVSAGQVDLNLAPAENVRRIADSLRRKVTDITIVILDRPRHESLINEIRSTGARIKLISDGDIMASISAAIRGTNDHLAIGIGGTRQAVLSAAALRCLGGELQAQLWPTRRAEIAEAAEHGIEDIDQIFTIDDLAPQEVIVAATGVRPRASDCAAIPARSTTTIAKRSTTSSAAWAARTACAAYAYSIKKAASPCPPRRTKPGQSSTRTPRPATDATRCRLR